MLTLYTRLFFDVRRTWFKIQFIPSKNVLKIRGVKEKYKTVGKRTNKLKIVVPYNTNIIVKNDRFTVDKVIQITIKERLAILAYLPEPLVHIVGPASNYKTKLLKNLIGYSLSKKLDFRHSESGFSHYTNHVSYNGKSTIIDHNSFSYYTSAAKHFSKIIKKTAKFKSIVLFNLPKVVTKLESYNVNLLSQKTFFIDLTSLSSSPKERRLRHTYLKRKLMKAEFIVQDVHKLRFLISCLKN